MSTQCEILRKVRREIMKSQPEVSTWQDYLKSFITDPNEKQRIEREVRIQPITLQRWISGESRPREENLRRLLRAIPEDKRPFFLKLLIQAFPGFEEEHVALESPRSMFPYEFYTQVFNAHAHTPPALFKQSLFDLILQQALEHFDPDRQGMVFSLACCVPPLSGGKVRSLRQVSSIGTPPWKRDDILKTLFLGSESLAGESVSRYRRQVVNSKTELSFSAIHWTEYEESAGAFPITRQARIAGCLVVSSAHPGYFTNERQDLLELCAEMLALAFEREEFFDLSQIALCPMPLYKDQEKYFLDIGKRVSRKFTEAQTEHRDINVHQARMLVWQEIEEEMLRDEFHRS